MTEEKKDTTEETYVCKKCGKEKKESQGNFVLGGSAFCCEKCCKKDDKEDSKVCEFC